MMPDLVEVPMSSGPARRKPKYPEAISIQHAADLLDVKQITIRRWIKKGYILAYRVGPQLIRIPRSEIVRMRKRRLEYLIEEDRPQYDRI